ncbi:hypothetical protein E1B28_001698 [Marasmius oreades]|uniref:FMN hydroxy acid dehydrogenase domain-containing protein n=1 Tax=Marasmius oreades TaxID=181124 RepID=A0A9P8AFP0_9AGAR|nr:uncharacterized protein E1B28_001698 [Marasmius oreades]KAG7099897.1 hypothetical protein E1B28_001698 [Marasmius oreades]
MDPKAPNAKLRTTPQYAIYQRENFWRVNDGEVPPFNTDPAKLEALAKTRLTENGWYYASSGASQSHTHLVNRQSFYRHRIIPRMLVDTNTRDTATTIFGHRVPAPIGFAPIGINKIYHPLGELPVAKVAGELGLPYCLSTAGSSSIEDVAKTNDELGKGIRFFQLYMPHDDELTISLLKRAVDSGFKACILTLDTWQLAWRHDDVSTSNYAFYRGIGADLGLSDPVFQKRLRERGIDPKKQPNEAGAAWIDNVWHGRAHTWEKVKWAMGVWKEISGDMPFCLKGIQSVEDARKAVDIGCHGIVVSNHAGRQVDGAVASLDALEKIAEGMPLLSKKLERLLIPLKRSETGHTLCSTQAYAAAPTYSKPSLWVQSSSLLVDCGYLVGSSIQYIIDTAVIDISAATAILTSPLPSTTITKAIWPEETMDQESTKKAISTRIQERAGERAAAQQAVLSDPKYKKYTQQVEKCLNSFDNVHEWADCIAFLKQLLKTFQSYMQFKEIPRKLIVSKRLSQCLNPALPTGVHQRALDVYAHILAVLGSEGLKRDLPIWSSGLFPFFEYAATSVKPTLLNLYDTHYLPLQSGLRPVTKSFILALLPGLEEETSEFFEKVISLLDRLSGTVSPSFFFQNVWLVMLTSPASRGTALNFLSRRLPQLHGLEDITGVVGQDLGLMIRAFAAALEDDNLLVRRSALDLLLQSLRVDSNTIRRASTEDRAIIMRAAISVVLRRDLSLNRRLYSWLLGPEEKSDRQIEFLKTNALDLLKGSLKEDMFTPSDEYSESRPFKILISLLDKWEIGSALTEVLIYDSFKAIKRHMESSPDGKEDVAMTASTLYEAAEPQMIWKQLLSAVFDDITGESEHFEAIDMVIFVLTTFTQDEEIQTIHLPLIFTAILDLTLIHLNSNNSRKGPTQLLQRTLFLLTTMLRQIPQSALLSRPEVTSGIQKASVSQRPYVFACTFYGIKATVTAPEPSGSYSKPFGSAFEGLISLSMSLSHNLIEASANLNLLREVFSQSLLLVDRLVGRLNTKMTLCWEPRKWLATVLDNLKHESANFTVVDRIVSLIVALQQTQGLEPNFSIDERATMSKMVTRLMYYLRPDCAAYHLRAVNLVWALEASIPRPHVESILAQSMASPESRNVQETYESFGVLWRLTEDNLLPGFKFKVPMMIILDTLKNEDPVLRRIGETWMRCNLRSYTRVLDPLLFDLLDPSIRRTPTSMKVGGKEIQGFLYERPLDQRYARHLLDMLLSIVQFGSQVFAKTARTTPIKRSQHPGLVERVEMAGFHESDATYLDVLFEILLQFLQSEPKASLEPTMNPYNVTIHSTSIDLLQAIVSRGELSSIAVESIEAVAIGKLYFFVHLGRLDLQNKLLHLLHSVISASIAIDNRQHRQRLTDTSVESHNSTDAGDAPTRNYSVNPLLIQTLVDGIAVPTNRSILQQWLDFVLLAVPQLQPFLQALVPPLNDCLCRQLLLSLRGVLVMSSKGLEFTGDDSSTATDAEFFMLLNALERLVLLGLAYPSQESNFDDDIQVAEKPTENTSILGYVSNVFSSDGAQTTNEDQLTPRSPAYRALHEGVRVLYLTWCTLSWTNPDSPSSRDESLSLIYNKTRLRCRRALEHIFRVQSGEVFESIVECWNTEFPDFIFSADAPFELVDVLIASAQNAVHMICESISLRSTGISERKRQMVNPDLSDLVLLKFLEQYLRRLEGPLAIQVWARFYQLTKEIAGSTKELKPLTFPALRCVTVLAEKVTQTTAMEDRRIRKDLQEIYAKLLDSCVAFVGKSYDSGSWIRRTAKEALVANGRDSPALRGETKLDEKLNVTTPSLTVDAAKPGPPLDLVSQITDFLALSVLPSLRRFLVDTDKVSTSCTNIAYYVVSPCLRGKLRPLEVDSTTIAIIQEMTRIPSAFKAWKSPVTELLNDNRLFSCTPESAEMWKPIIKSLFDSDKTAFPELLSKIASAPSANIFTNREYEMLLRSLNLRRLSLVLLAADKNHYLTQLPSIQEKLVDVLRNVTSPVVQSEVYLCIRVLLCRLSPHSLTSFWPVVLTELYRVLEQTVTVLPTDGAEDLPLILSACKCLDLLLALQTEEFQIHQWIFITDTVDAIYRPNGWAPEALMDQLAEVAGSLPRTTSNAGPSPAHNLSSFGNQRPMRRPILNSIHQIDSIRELMPFFSSVSMSTYESVYASYANVDWDVVERGLLEDMFDGR